MPAANTDKVLKVGTPGTATTLAAPGHNIAGTSISVVSTTNWPTDTAVAFAIDQVEIVDGRETRIPGTYTEWVGVVTGPTTIASMVLAYGTDQVYPAGSLTRVYIPVSSTQVNRFADAFLAQHKQDGSHEDITADSITADTATFDSLTINGTASAEGWSPLGATPDTITANGNKSYDLVFNGTDLTDTITEGMRVRTARTVAAPNTAFSLDGTNDYYVKTSPNKMTWTDDFAVSFWVYPTAYQAQAIVARQNGTSGWGAYMNAAGQINLVGYNGGTSNARWVTSYQSLPLNRWSHVSLQLDMSAHTATTTTSYVMINGVDVPAFVSQNGTNPSSLVQAGNLEIGSWNGGLLPFSGYIDQVAIYSAKVTQATILASMNQALTGSETNLASAYSNGSVNDLNTTTPNNLTATNGATTVANSPFGNRGASTTIDYGIVMAKSFSTNTTLTVQVPEGCTIPTTGGVSVVNYSTQNVPYGFPRDKGRWRLEGIMRSDANQSSPVLSTWYNLGQNLTVPIGAWRMGYEASLYVLKSAPATIDNYLTLSTANNSESDSMYTTRSYMTNTTELLTTMYRERPLVALSTATPYYLNAKFSGNGTNTHGIMHGLATPVILFVENAYL